MTGDMSPKKIVLNSVDRGAAHAIPTRDTGFVVMRIHQVDLSDIVIGQLAVRLPAFGLPSFADHVSGIVEVGPFKQMRWIAARRVIARVAHLHPFADLAVGHLVGHAVGVPVFTKRPDVSITSRESIAHEWPARVWSFRPIDFAQNGLNWIGLCRFVFTGRRAEASRMVNSHTCWHFKQRPAVVARPGNAIACGFAPTVARAKPSLARWWGNKRFPAGFASELDRHLNSLLGKGISERVGTVRETVRRIASYTIPSPMHCIPNYTRSDVLILGGS